MVVLYILLGLIGVVVLLLLVCLVRAVLAKKSLPVRAQTPVDEARAQKYAEDLAAMIQVPTISGPDDGTPELNELFAQFRDMTAQRFPRCIETMEQTLTGNTRILRWKGQDSSKPAVVLMSHTDVVPATGEWQHPAFSGAIAEGKVWGRGTVDTKGLLCCIYEACEALLEEGFVPPCDVYIFSSENEETLGDGSLRGVEYLLSQGVTLGMVCDEGGAVASMDMVGVPAYFAMLGVGEKGYSNVKFTAKSVGGHASAPPKNTPWARLAAFMNEVETKSPFEQRLEGPVLEMFQKLAPYMAFPLRFVLSNLWLTKPLLFKLLPAKVPMMGAMMQTTCAFTMAEGSPAPNVIPESASVIANIRFIPHQPMQASLDAIGAVAKKYDVEMEFLAGHDCPPVTSTQSVGYRYSEECVHKVFPDVITVPYMMTGGTDARRFAPHCPSTIRFAPLRLNGQQIMSPHGINENIDVDALVGGVDYFKTLLRGIENVPLDAQG